MQNQQREERGIVYRLVGGEPDADADDDAAPSLSGIIGIKRSAGLYCTNCEISLLREGEQFARFSNKSHCDQCPLCNVALDEGKQSKRFVQVSCFEWRMAPHRLKQRLLAGFSVVDSYNATRSIADFLSRDVSYTACPIQFYDKIEAN